MPEINVVKGPICPQAISAEGHLVCIQRAAVFDALRQKHSYSEFVNISAVFPANDYHTTLKQNILNPMFYSCQGAFFQASLIRIGLNLKLICLVYPSEDSSMWTMFVHQCCSVKQICSFVCFFLEGLPYFLMSSTVCLNYDFLF